MTMTKNELTMLHSYIDAATHYLEFGSGESTIHASKSSSIKTVDSVESSQDYVNENLKNDLYIIDALSAGKLCIQLIDIGETIYWGYPKNTSKKHLWPNYSLSIYSRSKKYDLVLVDGRFRVSCVLNYLLNTPEDCILIIHDFWNRPEYHIVLKYLQLKDRVDSMGVFTKAKNINLKNVQKLIKVYQYLPDDKVLIFKIKSKIKKCLTW
jgi:hypothetical protein